MTARNGRPMPRRTYSKHGLRLLKRAVKELGSRAIDKRTALGKALARWRSDLVADLGGAEAISTQEEAMVDLAVKTKLLLDSVDAWLLIQPTLINARRRALLPVVKERTQLADALARYMTQLGLKRRARPAPSLTEYLASHYGGAEDPEGGDGPLPGSSPNASPEEQDREPETDETETFRPSSPPSPPSSPSGVPNPAGSPHREVATPQEIAGPRGAQEPQA